MVIGHYAYKGGCASYVHSYICDTRYTLAIAKKTLDENHFTTAQKTMDRKPPSFKIGNRVFQKQTTRQMVPQMETWIQDCLY